MSPASLWRTTRAILRTDARRLLRDQFLLGAAAYMVAVAVALRWVIPWLQAELLRSAELDLGVYLPLGVSYVAVVNASVITGILGGFLLLETKEEGVVLAMRVTPAPPWLHLVVLGGVVIASAAALTVALSAIIGVGVPPWPAVVASACLGAPSGAVMALVLAAGAANKVEAFALMKVTAIVGLVPVAAWFLPEPLQLLAGVVPPYWACKLWWAAAAGEPWLWTLAPGLLVTGLWLADVSRRALRVMS